MKCNLVLSDTNEIVLVQVDDALKEALSTEDKYCTDSTCTFGRLSKDEVAQYFVQSHDVREFKNRWAEIKKLAPYLYADESGSRVSVLGDDAEMYLENLKRHSQSIQPEDVFPVIVESQNPNLYTNVKNRIQKFMETELQFADSEKFAEIQKLLWAGVLSSNIEMAELCQASLIRINSEYPELLSIDDFVKFEKYVQTAPQKVSGFVYEFMMYWYQEIVQLPSEQRDHPDVKQRIKTLSLILLDGYSQGKISKNIPRDVYAYANENHVNQAFESLKNADSEKQISFALFLNKIAKYNFNLFSKSLCVKISTLLDHADHIVFNFLFEILYEVDVTLIRSRHVDLLISNLKYEDSSYKANDLLKKIINSGSSTLFSVKEAHSYCKTILQILSLGKNPFELMTTYNLLLESSIRTVRDIAMEYKNQIYEKEIESRNLFFERISKDTLPRPDGTEVVLGEYLGFSEAEATVVVFWATWCHPCVQEIPLLNEVYSDEAWKGKIQIRAIASNSLDEVSSEKLSEIENQPAYPFLVDPDRKIQVALGVNSFPTAFVVDRNGVLLGEISPRTKDDLIQNVRYLLSQSQ